MLSRSLLAGLLGAVLCASLALAFSAQAADLDGYRRTEVAARPLVSNRFVRIEQSGDEVTFEYTSLPASYGGAFQGTTGETCSTGASSGGSPVADCTDATGRWLEYSVSYLPNAWNGHYGVPTEVEEVSIEQERGFVVARGASGQVRRVGSIDQNTGALRVHSPAIHFFCGSYSSETITISPDGSSYGGTGNRFLGVSQFRCVIADDVTVTGLRCAGDEGDSGECLVDSCTRCSGSPESCLALPDTTPCRHEDPRTAVGTCSMGSCVATVSSQCPPCQVFDGDECVSGPRDNCRQSVDPRANRNRLRLNARGQVGRHEIVRWNWRGGEETSPLDLGAPRLSSGISLCVFDAEGKTWDSAEVSRFVPGVPCDETQTCDPDNFDARGGWRELGSGSFEYEPSDLFEAGKAASIEAGPEGESSSRVVQHGGRLEWGMPLALPVRAQLQIDSGACFENTFDDTAVRKNDHNLFRARIRN